MHNTFIAHQEPNEKSNTQSFWLSLIRDIFGIINPEDYIQFEKRVLIEHIGFIDAYIPSTGIIIEQKSPGKDLDAAFAQAKNYYDWLPISQRGRYIITCDFNVLHVHDLETPHNPPKIIPVAELSRDKIDFLLTPGETLPIEVAVSVKAGELVKSLYESLLASLPEAVSQSDHSSQLYKDAIDNINIFCVRLVFLLYAEDSGLFRKKQFHNYLQPRSNMAATALRELFRVLNTDIHKRSPYLSDELNAFPFVNGGLFQKDTDFPQLDSAALRTILHDMSESFDWSGISPAIFGAIFESIINEDTRKQQGIHYTSITNIHKLIDPLFLDELNTSLDSLLALPESPQKFTSLTAFQDKLASLRFLDPACGSGNFLTESFIHLRRIENKILAALPEDSRPPVKVSITQFHGIEVHDFAVNVARTALWISDHQMLKETQQITGSSKPPLPLTEYDGIVEADSFNADIFSGWDIPHDDMLYIMGNPPFLGYSQQNGHQKKTVRKFFGQAKTDYVSCWFWYTAERMKFDSRIRAAFVATNSIVQGEQPAYVFKPISENFGTKIAFARLPFVWENELPDPSKMAHVHVVVIGLSGSAGGMRRLYTDEGVRLVENINFYLADGPDEDVAVPTRTPVFVNALHMIAGSHPYDGGHLLIEAKDYADFVKREPKAAKYIKRFMMGDEFINNKLRYCLWLVGAEPSEIRSMPLVYERVKACKADRLKGGAERQKYAKTAWLFREQINPKHYIAIPVTSSEKRRYIPIGWLDDSVIPGNQLRIIPDATLYHFGVLTSRGHMAWMRRVSGRLEMRYSYSNTIVYNTFAWPEPSAKQRERIEQTAQGILSARAAHPGNSFADLYDDTLMPEDLRRAHERNDAAVCGAYGWDEEIEEEEIVRRLFVLYHGLSGK